MGDVFQNPQQTQICINSLGRDPTGSKISSLELWVQLAEQVVSRCPSA